MFSTSGEHCWHQTTFHAALLRDSPAARSSFRALLRIRLGRSAGRRAQLGERFRICVFDLRWIGDGCHDRRGRDPNFVGGAVADAARNGGREQNDEDDRCQSRHPDTDALHALSGFIGRQPIGGSRFNHWLQI
jgi:hypothetical protein